MKILFCHPFAELYGSDRMGFETAVALRERGHDVSVVLPGRGPLAAMYRSHGFQIIEAEIPVVRKKYLDPRRFVGFAWSLLRSIRRARRILRSASPDLVYVNTVCQPSWIWAARSLRIPALCHVREAETEGPWILRMALNATPSLANFLVFNSQHSRRTFHSSSLRHPDCEVAYNGKDWGPYYRGVEPDPGVVPVLSLIGRLSPRKGQDVAIAALKELRQRGQDVQLRIVGDTFTGYEWYESDLRSMVREGGLDGHVVFTGFKEDVVGEIERSDIVLVPSRVEAFGTVAVEGMAAMRPVIASRSGGLEEVVEDGTSGLLVPAGDPQALATAIADLVDDPDKAAKLAKGGYDRAWKTFSLHAYRETLDACVTRAVGR